MIDPLVSLAFSIQSNKGVYAVLLGSGISRSSGIPTGWDIVLDLSQKLAGAMSEDTKGDPEAWYSAKFKKEPDYSDLLDNLCKTQAERQQLLRSYFEPTAEEREQGLKQPTKAHRAIAKLMVAGYIRVAITTNFDRLLEQAIQDEGTAPVVIMSDDGIVGAVPLAHQKCCIIKLHGDYLDTRIKNTPSEVGKYEKKTNAFLNQVFDQFGLIVCGWSAQWDLALRAAIERCQSRRFTMFWASHGTPKDDAKQLISLRDGAIIPIADADSFFNKLADMVQGIDESNTSNPASLSALIALTKRYLADPQSSIKLADLLYDEVQSTRAAIASHEKNVLAQQGNSDFNKIFAEYRRILVRLQSVVVLCCEYGPDSIFKGVADVIQRMAVKNRDSENPSIHDGLRLYPALILFYSAGLIALAHERMDLAAVLLTKPSYRDLNNVKQLILSPMLNDSNGFCKHTIEGESKIVPKSEHLFVVLREPLLRFIPDPDIYDQTFDDWEYLLAMVFMDVNKSFSIINGKWAPLGRYFWKAKQSVESAVERQGTALEQKTDQWPPLLSGLFGGNVDTAKQLQRDMLDMIGRTQLF
jgi:hypothetical protein